MNQLLKHLCLLQTEVEEEILNKKRSKKSQAKYKARQKFAKVEQGVEDQFATGRVLGNVIFIVNDFLENYS